jgi:hypothetical protein
MKKESKSIDKIKGSKVNPSKVHGGKRDLPLQRTELNINEISSRDVLPIKGGERSKGIDQGK